MFVCLFVFTLADMTLCRSVKNLFEPISYGLKAVYTFKQRIILYSLVFIAMLFLLCLRCKLLHNDTEQEQENPLKNSYFKMITQ